MTVGQDRSVSRAQPIEHEIHGPIVAAVTPFTGNRIDIDALRRYLDWLWEHGAKTILVNGTTGEFFATTAQERLAILAQCRRWFPGTVIAHVGAGSVADTIVQLDQAQALADYLAVIAPYFYADPPEDGVLEYFRQILDRAHRPVLLYNFPHHTQTPITPTALAELARQFPHLVGIKDSGADRDITRGYAATGLQVFLGDDNAAAHITEVGVDGIVTGGGNPVIELPVRIAAALHDGDPGEATRLQKAFDDYSHTKRASQLPEIAFVKAALGARIPHFPTHTRPPLITATQTQTDTIHHYLHHTILPMMQ
ncbi:MAG: dihydrodipicolinate synthase family protein [Mycobacterium sp.]|nr:dihydrodipicolinate synthase family protein [Mycobacterium sp.]